MKVIDLKTTPKIKVESEILRLCGGHPHDGKFFFMKEKGLSGFTFTDHQLKDKHAIFKSILAFYKFGLGIYCRNIYANRLVLISESDVKSIEIIKNKDILQPKAVSIYSLLKKFGFAHETASKYLMPIEVIEEHVPHCIIRTEDTYFTLNLEKLNTDTLINTLNKTNFAKILDISIKEPLIQNR